MILEILLNLLKFILFTLFNFLPNLPCLPLHAISAINNGVNLIFSYGLNLLPLFINIRTISTLAPLAIVIWNFDKIYSILFWIYKKLPFGSN